jgi:hypothetical protein
MALAGNLGLSPDAIARAQRTMAAPAFFED